MRSSRISPRAAPNEDTVRLSERSLRIGSARTTTSSTHSAPSSSSCAMRVSIWCRRRDSAAIVCSTSLRRKSSMLRSSAALTLEFRISRDLVEIESQILQDQNSIQLCQLRDGVVTIARLRVGMRRREQPDLVVEAQQRAETRAILEKSPILNMPPSEGIAFAMRGKLRKSLRRPIDSTTARSRRKASRITGCRTMRSYSAAKRGISGPIQVEADVLIGSQVGSHSDIGDRHILPNEKIFRGDTV